MSYSVDNRVVQMQFRNEQFEHGIKQTIASLTNLKSKLDFKQPQVNLDTFQKKVNTIDLSRMEMAVESLANRFSNMGIVGMSVLDSITKKAIGLATKLEQITVGQIISGGKNRAQKVADARFKLEGLLDTAEEVQSAFDSASKSVDGTAYGLDAAVTVASNLATSGIQLGEDMDKSLRGVAGVAAMTGSSFEDIGEIFADVASMGKLTGMSMTRLNLRGINVVSTLGEQMKKTNAEIKDMVSKGQVSFKDFAEAMNEAFGDQAGRANETLTGSLSNVNAALSRIGEIFYSGIIENKDLINFVNNLRLSINKVKKAMEPLKEPFANLVSSVSNLGSALLNMFGLDGFTSFVEKVAHGMQKLSDFVNSFSAAVTGIYERTLKPIADTVQQSKEATKELEKISERQKNIAIAIWEKGGFGNGEERKKQLGVAYDNIQMYVNAYKQAGYDTAKADEIYSNMVIAHKKEIAEAQNGTTEEAKKTTNVMAKATASINLFINSVLTVYRSFSKVITAATTAFRNVFSFKDLKKDISSINKAFNKFVHTLQITNEDGEKLTSTFEGAFSIIDLLRQVITSVITNGLDILGPALATVGEMVIGVTSELGKLVKGFNEETKANDGVNSGIKKFISYAKQAAGAAKEFFSRVNQLPIVQSLKEEVITFADNGLQRLYDLFDKAGGKVESFFKSFEDADSSGMDKAVAGVNTALTTFIGLTDNSKENVGNFFGWFKKKKTDLEDTEISIAGINTNVEKLGKQSKKLAQSKNLGEFTSNAIDSFGGVGDKVQTFMGKIVESFNSFDAAKAVLLGVGGSLTVFTMALSYFTFNASEFMRSFAKFPDTVVKTLKQVGEVFNGVKEYFHQKGTAQIIRATAVAIGVLAGSLIAMTFVDPDKLRDASISLSIVLGVITTMVYILSEMNKVNTTKDKVEAFNKTMATYVLVILSLAASVAILAAAFSILSEITWDKNLLPAFVSLMVLLISMFGIAVGLSKWAPQFSKGGMGIVLFAASLWIVVRSLERLTKVDPKKIKPHLKTLLSVMGLLALVAIAAGKLKWGSSVGILSILSSIFIIELTLKYILEKGVTPEDILSHIEKFIPVLAMLAGITIYLKKINGLGAAGYVGTILATTAGIALVLYALSKMTANTNPENLGYALVAIAEMFAGLAGLLFVISQIGEDKDLKQAKSVITRIVTALTLMTGLIFVLGIMDHDTLDQGLVGMAGLMGLLAAVILATKYAGQIDSKALLSMIGIIGTLALVIGLMSFIDDKLALLQAAGILGTALLAFGLSVYLASQNANTTAAKTVLNMVWVIVAIAGALTAMLYVGKSWDAIGIAAMSLSAVLLALGWSMSIMRDSFKGTTKAQLEKLLDVIHAFMGVIAVIGLALTAILYTGASPAQIATAGGFMIGILIAMAALVAAFNKLEVKAKPKSNSKSSGSMDKSNILLLLLSLIAIAATIALFAQATKDIPLKDLTARIGLLAGALAVLAGLSVLLKKLGEGGAGGSAGMLVPVLEAIGILLAIAAVALIFAHAVDIIVKAFKMLVNIPFNNLLSQMEGLKLMAIVLLSFAGIGVLAGIGLIALGAGLLAVSTPILILSAAAALFMSQATPFMNALSSVMKMLLLLTSSKEFQKNAKTISVIIGEFIVEVARSIALGMVKFAQEITTNAAIIIMAIRQIIFGVIAVLSEAFFAFTEAILDKMYDFLKLLNQKVPEIGGQLALFVYNILDIIAQNSNVYGYQLGHIAIGALEGMLRALIDWWPKLSDTLVSLVVELVVGIADALVDNGDLISNAISRILIAALIGVSDLLKGLLGAIGLDGIMEENLNTLKEQYAYLAEQGAELKAEKERKAIEKEGEKTKKVNADVTSKIYDTSAVAAAQGNKTSSAYIDSAKDALSGGTKQLSAGVEDNFLNSAEQLKSIANETGTALGQTFGISTANGVESTKEVYNKTVEELPATAVEELKKAGYREELTETGTLLVRDVATGLEDTSAIEESGGELQNGILGIFGDGNFLENIKNKGNDVIGNFFKGSMEGVDDFGPQLEKKIQDCMDGSVVQITMETLEEHSPSKLSYKIMGYWFDGMVNSTEDSAPELEKAQEAAMGNLITGLESTVDRANKLGNNLAYHPTITPVIDSTNMDKYNSWAADALDNRTTLQMAADSQLTLDNASQYALASQIELLRGDINKMANQDLSKIMDGVSINVDASTNVDGTPLMRRSSNFTINQINRKEQAILMATGGRG